ncbi:hypothetical protein OTK49_20935 [Vibrio coralliirubri]|uniref:hypothetical protein n=1 Tax=Vibrio coralliirubri TaxID=1516159 RepID=UPI002284FF9A|nr:hypothetical protein [Vibrio coralliirubri]MCY9864985.1 hypothetical protein [Vibrio coralliirubri]
MKIYHGTSSTLLPKILQEGLVPNTNSNWDHTVQSQSGFNYLTSTYATYFAVIATAQHGGEPVVIELEINEANLYPDEDYIAARLQHDHPERFSNLSQADLESLVASIDVTKHKQLWEESLNLLGNVSYMGTISPECITRHSAFNDKFLMFSSADATISMANYRLCGNWYRHAIKAALGDITIDELRQVSTFDI